MRLIKISNFSSSETANNNDEYLQVTQEDLDRSVFRIELKPSPRKQSITISLDANLIEYLKLKAGENGYQSLINEILRQAKDREEMEKAL